MDGKKTMFAITAVLTLLCASSFCICNAYAYAGDRTDAADSSDLDINSAVLRLCGKDGGDLVNPLFESQSVHYVKNGTTYDIEESVVVNGECALKVGGTASEISKLGVAYKLNSSGTGDAAVHLMAALSTSPIGTGAVFKDIPLNGDFVELTIWDAGGNPVSIEKDTLYYIFVKVKAETGLASPLTAEQNIQLTFGAAATGSESKYIATDNTLVAMKITDIVTVDSGDGYVSDAGLIEGHKTAAIWTDEGMKRCVGLGETTICTLDIADGNMFCIKFDSDIGGWGWFGKVDLKFTITYTDNGKEYKIEKTLSKADYKGTTAKGFIGKNTKVTYNTVAALDAANGWMGSETSTNIKVTVTGSITEWSEAIGGHAYANIIIK